MENYFLVFIFKFSALLQTLTDGNLLYFVHTFASPKMNGPSQYCPSLQAMDFKKMGVHQLLL